MEQCSRSYRIQTGLGTHLRWFSLSYSIKEKLGKKSTTLKSFKFKEKMWPFCESQYICSQSSLVVTVPGSWRWTAAPRSTISRMWPTTQSMSWLSTCCSDLWWDLVSPQPSKPVSNNADVSQTQKVKLYKQKTGIIWSSRTLLSFYNQVPWNMQ